VAPSLPALAQYDTALCVTFRDAKECQLVTIRGLTNECRPGADDAEGAAVAGSVLLRWRLSAPVSVAAVDPDQAALVLGMKDGSLCLYNLVARCLTSVLAKHESAVSSVCFSQVDVERGSAAQHFIVSGAEDGSLCLFLLRLPVGAGEAAGAGLGMGMGKLGGLLAAPLPAPGVAVAEAGAVCVTTSFQSFRLDVNAGVSIVSIRAIGDYSWAAVQCSDGMTLVYDVLGGSLLGRLALYSGMVSRQVAWKICTFRESALTLALPPAPAATDDLGYELEAKQEEKEEKEEGGRGGGPPKELADPNAFVRLPPAKRAAKYAINMQYDWAAAFTSNSIACSSALGYHAMYLRNDLPVLAFFKVDDLFVNFYPAIAALLTKRAAYAIDKSSFFKKLSKHERCVCAMCVTSMSDSFRSERC
jgi:hypothetical protein